ncbi:MAG: hypothetical protein N4A35_17095 [Flavobacteriales bacterium]|jgi:hypothetical protein|nr:hypothetical protein [Flavobacteriales bacterium]
MIATGKRKIKSGAEYDRFFPRAKGEYKTVKQSASLDDTIELMQKVVRETLADTRKIAHHLQADTALKTCQQIWAFCYHHIQYEK